MVPPGSSQSRQMQISLGMDCIGGYPRLLGRAQYTDLASGARFPFVSTGVGHPLVWNKTAPSARVSGRRSRRLGIAGPYSMVMVGPPSRQWSIPPTIDRIAVRRTFARAGDGAPEFARVMLTAREGLLERLVGIRIAPRRILDLGAGTGATARRLARRFHGADVVSVDPVVSLLHRARSRAPRWFSRHRYVTAEAERLPLSSHSMDLILSNLAMPWFDPVDHALSECLRVLRPGGLLLLSTLGSDTLKELAFAWSGGCEPHRMHPFADMHVLGDALVHAGFADVVMDVQRTRLQAPDFWRLCRVLSRSGGSGALSARRRGLSAVETFRAAAVRYESLRGTNGALPVSVELVFGHAWAPGPARAKPASVLPRMDWSPGS